MSEKRECKLGDVIRTCTDELYMIVNTARYGEVGEYTYLWLSGEHAGQVVVSDQRNDITEVFDPEQGETYHFTLDDDFWKGILGELT